jgi:hypothetical protein
VIVVFDPKLDALARFFEAIELSPRKELPPDAGPEALDLAEGHRVMWTALNVGDAILAHLGLEAAHPAPACVLPAIVG